MNGAYQHLHGIVIGLGSIGNRHLNNLLSLGVGNMTVVRRPDSHNSQFTPPANVDVQFSLAEALAMNPDFAIVCNPSHLHASTATECLEAGVHVLIEKPLGRCVGPDEQRLIDVASTSDRVCAMAYCMRYHPAYRLAHEQIRSGTIGRCLYAKAWFEGYLPDWHPWEDYKQSYAGLKEQGGGVLRTLDHEIDFMNWVLGPAQSADGSAINTGGIGIEVDDLAMYCLHHPDRVTSQITTSFCRKPASRGFEFVGDAGVLSFRMEEGKLLRGLHTYHREQEMILDLANYDVNQMYLELASAFLRAGFEKETDIVALIDAGFCSLASIQQIDGDRFETTI